jgi:hypothetical protein
MFQLREETMAEREPQRSRRSIGEVVIWLD